MKNNTITNLIETTMKQLKDDFNLTNATLKSYKHSSFRPIEEFFKSQKTARYDQELMDDLQSLYETQLEKGDISKTIFNLRFRGIRIITEIHDQGYFEWKVFSHRKKELLNEYFEKVLNDFSNILTCGVERRIHYESIIRRFFNFLMQRGHNDFTKFNSMIINVFLSEISADRPKSMDDVIYGMRKLFLHLNKSGESIDFNILLLARPKTHRGKVHPYMNIDEISELLNHIDQTTSKGKRDYALLLLASTTGLRAGDLANLKLKDVEWERCEISIVQGKTKDALFLPLNSIVRDALANYILNGRPVSDSSNIFLRNNAPYNELNRRSLKHILNRYLKSLGIERKVGDGKTFHGIRRMLASNMVASKVPITTISQVLGHKDMNVTNSAYISIDMEGLKNCTLDFSSLKRGDAK